MGTGTQGRACLPSASSLAAGVCDIDESRRISHLCDFVLGRGATGIRLGRGVVRREYEHAVRWGARETEFDERAAADVAARNGRVRRFVQEEADREPTTAA